MSSVHLAGVKKAFGNFDVLHDIDLEIADGEFVAFVGPSGCGKSTLLRMIAGLETVTAGQISIGSRVVNNVPPKDRDIAMVFQSYALYPHKTVRENMVFALRLQRKSNAEIERRLGAAAAILGLDKLLDRHPGELSGGQRQRVAMGRAIVREPEVFLFDEPLSNLDAKLRVTMRSEIKDLHRRLGATMIYVTHDQVEAMTMADRVVVLRDGRIEQAAPPAVLYDHPANVHVATFIGSPSMNILPANAQEGPEGTEFRLADGQVVTGPATAQGLRGQVLIGIRPEDITVSETGPRAQVIDVEPTGADTVAYVHLAGTRIAMLVRRRVDLQSGQDIHLSFNPQACHFFNPDTGLKHPTA